MNNNENATAAYYYKNKETGTIAGQGFWLKPVEQLLEIIQKNNDENKDSKTYHAITDPDILAVLIRSESASPVGYLRDYLDDISRNFRDCMSSLEAVEETVSSIEEIIHADKDCDWKLESIDNIGEIKFSTSCGSSFYCGTEDPDKSGFQFCPKCGREIYVKKAVKKMKDEFCKNQNCGHYIPKEIAGIGGAPMGSGRCTIMVTGVKKIKKCPRLTFLPEDKE